MIKLKLSVFGILMALSLSASYSAVAMEQDPSTNKQYKNNDASGNFLSSYLNFCYEQSNNTINTIRNCSPNKTQIVALLVLVGATMAEAQNGTDCTKCMDMLSQCMANNTALLNQILANTTPTPGVDNYTAYVYTIWGAIVSAAGTGLTFFGDPFWSFVSAKIYSDKTENNIIKEIKKHSPKKIKETKKMLKNVLAIIIAKLDNNINKEEAEKKIDDCIKTKNFTSIVSLVNDATNLGSTTLHNVEITDALSGGLKIDNDVIIEMNEL